MINDKCSLMIVAGEASGDAHAARLVQRLREQSGAEIEFFGATGALMREAGVETVVNADDLSIVGLPEIARALPLFWRTFQTLKNAAIERRPDAVILIDFPEFNLKLAKALKKRGLKIIYYISPQLWAWRKYRVRGIRRYVDLLLTILPFEKKWYENEGITHVEYVGNPSAREVHANQTKEQFCAKHQLDAAQPIISMLAGSRHKEITRILPKLLQTASLMNEKNENLQFVIALAPMRKPAEVEEAALGIKNPPQNLTVVQNETFDALNASDAAAVASGTATLETAIIGTPLAIVYQTSPLNYHLFNPLISTEHFGLVNLIAGNRLAREFVQYEFTPEKLSAELFRLLEPETNRRMRQKLNEIAETLGHGGAARRAATAILREINE